MSMTKHEQILEHIELLPVGEKISVRGIAKKLDVSEGTAYRAIKEAETIGLVSTIERVGTIRIEKKATDQLERLSFNELVKIIDGDVLAGHTGLDKILDRFVIGAMTEKSMERYITPGALMIVGDREGVQRLALMQGAAVLLTGGFDVSDSVKGLADELALPILRTAYDTFTVATMINRAISDQMIKKDMTLVEDLQIPLSRTYYLTTKDTISDYHQLVENTHFTRFPVVNKAHRLVGMVTTKDVAKKQDSQSIETVMTKEPRYAKSHMSVASVGHQMIWDGLEIVPVVEDSLNLIGIISRRDVMKSMQSSQEQPQMPHKLTDQIANQIVKKERSGQEGPVFTFIVSPQMVNNLGTLSFGVLNQIISHVVRQTILAKHNYHSVIEQISLYYFQLIQMDSEIEIDAQIIEVGRRSAKLDVCVTKDNMMASKAIVVTQLMDPV